jgi:DNA polymerase-3 subunit gamma/tau
MSYLVLARKWRPQTFADVVGQQSVVRTLQNALKLDRVAHALLFSGVRGVGKTTLARIMAKAINCEGETASPPCNQCDSCLEITAGNAMDLHEIDGASNRGIQEIRELKENIRFFPTRSRYKVIIIDEVHMLTTEAFNALLKTLEEPPKHVYFMFATTELHKIPVTILSRCQRYELKRVPFVEIIDFLKKISAAENVVISESALQMIAREADGSIRDGLSLLDQTFSFCGNEVKDEDVRQILGLVDRTIFSELANSLLAGNVAASIEILGRAYGAGLDLKRFTNDLLGYFRALIICRTTADPATLLDMPDQELASLQKRAKANTAETIYHIFQLLLKGAEEMRYSAHPRLALEMAFIKAAQTGQIMPVASLLERLDAFLGKGDAAVSMPEAHEYKSSEMVRPTAKVTEPASEKYKTPAVPPPASPAKTVNSNEKVSGETATEPHSTDENLPDVRKSWDDFIAYVKARKIWMGQILNLCSGVHQEGRDLTLKFDRASDCKVLQESDNMKLLTEFGQDFFQQEIRITLSSSDKAGNGDNGDDAMSPQEERRALGDDPLVQMTTEIFGGQVSGIRTGPRSR